MPGFTTPCGTGTMTFGEVAMPYTRALEGERRLAGPILASGSSTMSKTSVFEALEPHGLWRHFEGLHDHSPTVRFGTADRRLCPPMGGGSRIQGDAGQGWQRLRPRARPWLAGCLGADHPAEPSRHGLRAQCRLPVRYRQGHDARRTGRRTGSAPKARHLEQTTESAARPCCTWPS